MSTVDRKHQILTEATRLFSEAGYDKVTIKQLAEACGITEPALYRHFESKEAIYLAVLDSLEERLRDRSFFIELETETDLETFLRRYSEHIIRFFTRNQDLYRLLLFSALRGHGRAKRVFQVVRGTYVQFLVHRLEWFQDKGVARSKNLEITARCFTGMVFDCALSVTLWKGFQGKNYSPDEVVANNIPIYAAGLRSLAATPPGQNHE